MTIVGGFSSCGCVVRRRRAAQLHAENTRRQQRGLPLRPIDERLLAAHRHGLPECAGVALGVDRLLALKKG